MPKLHDQHATQLLITYSLTSYKLTYLHAGKRGEVRHGHEYERTGDLRDGARCSRWLRIDQEGVVTGGRPAGANTALATRQCPGSVITLATIECPKPLLTDWQAECRNIEDKNQILRELEQGVGSVKCNSLVIGLMHKALVAQTKAAHARQVNNLDRLFDGL